LSITMIAKQGRILAIDFGTKRVGLAITDELQIAAYPFETIQVGGKGRKPLDRIVDLIKEKNVIGIVLGKPLNMNGTEGEMVEQVNDFADELKLSTKIPLAFLDERLTSLQAKRIIQKSGRKPSRQKDAVDRLAATILLQSFLDSRI